MLKTNQYFLRYLLSKCFIVFLSLGTFICGNLSALENSVQIKSDGTKIIQDKDGSVIQIKPDGTKMIKKADGTIIVIKPDGTKTIKKSNGETVEVKPNGEWN